jgi:excisionase family DNA binding protein
MRRLNATQLREMRETHEFLWISELAEMLEASPHVVRRLAHAGRLPAVKLPNGTIRIHYRRGEDPRGFGADVELWSRPKKRVDKGD